MYPPSASNGSAQAPAADPAFVRARNDKEEFFRHFGFRESPLGVTPNPAFLFLSRVHRAALQSMIHSIESNLGFTVLLGNPGLGKTTLLLQLLSQYRDAARTAFIFQTQCKRHELLRHVATDLGLDVPSGDEVSLHQRLQETLLIESRAGRKVLIFIDEAQNLQPSSLEAVRLLSDFETPKAKLMHIILAGSDRLGEILLGTELSQLAQRVSTICRLEPLGPEEVSRYLIFRLRVAGCGTAENIFSPDALREVAKHSKGIPRVVNSVSYRALYLAYIAGERHVRGMLVQQAAKDLDLAHSTLNESTVSHFLRTQKPADPLPDLLSSEEDHTPYQPEVARQKVWSQDIQEPAAEQEMQFRPQASAPKPVEQTPVPQQESITVGPHCRRGKELVGARAASPGSSRPGSVSRTPGSRFGAQVRRLKNDRLTVALAVLLILLVTLGWRTWDTVFSKTGAVAHQAAGTMPFVPEQKAWGALFDLPQLDGLIDAGKTTTNAADHKIGPNASIATNHNSSGAPMIVEAVPQTMLPSRIPRPAPAQEVSPSDMAISAANTRLSLKSVPLPVPRLEATAPQPTTETNTPLDTETNMDAVTDAQQTSVPRPIKTVQPEYPSLAKLRRVQGDVLLELQIDSKGKVRSVRTISGNSLLREAAEDAARQWQYPPSPADNPPTPAVTRVRINFSLNPDSKR